MSDIQTAIDWFSNTEDKYTEARDYYEGRIPERFSTDRLRRALGNTIKQPSINFAATPVKSVANRLEMSSINADSPRGDELVQRLWEDNELEIEVNDAHLWTLVYGDSYLMVWPDGDGYTINYNSPLTTVLFYDEENPRREVFGAKQWLEGDKTRINLYYPGFVQKFISKTKKADSQRDFRAYVTEDTDENGIMVSPFDFIPIFHLRTRKQYGEPEHKAAWGPQDMITKNVVGQLVANDYHGLPQRWVMSGPNNDDVFGEDDDTEDPDLRNGAGDVWWLKNVEKVGQFAAAEPKSFLEPYREYVKTIAVLTDTPVHHFEGGLNAPSGESLRVAEAPLTKKVRTRQTMFQSTWKRLFRALLRAQGVQDSVSVTWQSIESVSLTEMWSNVKAAQDAGLTLEQALRQTTDLDDAEIQQIIGSETETEAA